MGRGRRHQRHVDVVVARELAHRGVGPHAGEVRLGRLAPLEVGVGDGHQLDAFGARHPEPVVVSHAAERAVAHDADADVPPAAVQIGAQRARRGAGPAPECGAPRRCCRGRTPRRGPLRGVVSTTAARSRRATLTSTMTLPSASGVERHEAVHHGELRRDPGRDVGVGLGDAGVVLAGRRLGAGDRAEQPRPEPVALGGHAADGHQRRAPLHRRSQRREELERLGRLRPVDHDGVVSRDVGQRVARRHEARLSDFLGQGDEGGATALGQAGGEDEDGHGVGLDGRHLARRRNREPPGAQASRGSGGQRVRSCPEPPDQSWCARGRARPTRRCCCGDYSAGVRPESEGEAAGSWCRPSSECRSARPGRGRRPGGALRAGS